MGKRVAWKMLPWPGREEMTLEAAGEIVLARGFVEADLGEGPFRLSYEVQCDTHFRFDKAELLLEREGLQRGLQIAREPGGWLVDGFGRPDLDRATDIDIMASPFTNTLPIRNLLFVPGQARRIHVAYIRVPDLAVAFQEQDYTQLTAESRPGRFRYHGVESGFVAEIGVDADGLVVDYGEIWRRIPE